MKNKEAFLILVTPQVLEVFLAKKATIPGMYLPIKTSHILIFTNKGLRFIIEEISLSLL